MSELLESLDNGVLTLTFNRPERHNGMTESLSDLFGSAVARAANNPAVRCVVITGAGKTFSAGGDMAKLNDMSSEQKTPEEREELRYMLREGMKVSQLLHEMPKPTLAIINGAAAGAGLIFALACDLRFCLDSAKLTTAFAKIGACGDSGISYFLPRIVGPAKAYELMFNSDVITGEQAHSIGLVTKVAPADEFQEAAQAYAQQLADLPTIAIGHMKKNLVASHSSTLSEILDLETDGMIECFETEDHRQAISAFLNKTKPTFRGQ